MSWRAEKRPGRVVEAPGLPLQRLLDEWWLTDGTESFKMFSKFTAEMLANYLNAQRRES